MKYQWLRNEAAPADELRVFALGWGQDAGWWDSDAEPEADVLLLFAWHQAGEAPRRAIETYPRRRLTAWSFGVWAAARHLAGIAWESATAVNGTLWPVDGERGIEPAIFLSMLAQWREGVTLEKFRRRSGIPEGKMRDSDCDCRAELAYFGGEFEREMAVENMFDRALIARADRIFAPERQAAAWDAAGVARAYREGAHYWSAREAWDDDGNAR